MPSRTVAIAVGAAMVASSGCTGPGQEPPAARPSPTKSNVTSPQPSPPTVADLAAAAPVDLIVDLGPERWTARYNNGAGIEVTPDNWAEAYELSRAAATKEIAAAETNGLQAAATEQWQSEPTDPEAGPTMRLTIRQFRSLAAVEDAWWENLRDAGRAPAGVTPPSGIDIVCRDAFATDGDGYNRDTYYADCMATIGDRINVYLSSVDSDGKAATSRTVDGITRWLETIMGAS